MAGQMKLSSCVRCLAALSLVGAPFAPAAQEDRQCLARFEAERLRIEREFAAQAPKAGDQEAQGRWLKRLTERMEAAGRDAEACSKRSRPAPTPGSRAALDACLDDAARRLTEAEKPYAGRTLTAQEQRALREIQQRLIDERSACARPKSR